jgi:hypothetical protein
MPDYKNGKIYTIRCKIDASLIYVGSTTEKLSIRMAKHRYDSKKSHTLPFYKQIKDWNDWYIELYEDFPCERKEQLEKREGEIIRDIGNLNKIIPGSKEQKNEEYGKTYYQQKKEYFQQYGMEYYKQNKEKIQEHYKIKITCECGCEIRKDAISQHKKSNKHRNLLQQISDINL